MPEPRQSEITVRLNSENYISGFSCPEFPFKISFAWGLLSIEELLNFSRQANMRDKWKKKRMRRLKRKRRKMRERSK